MGDYNRSDRGRGGGRRFGGGTRDFGRREMHRATCAQCGKDCEVPFRPNSDRPVYCSDCFEKRRNESGDSRRPDNRGYGRGNFEERRAYSPDRSDRGNSGGGNNRQLMDQLKSLNVKLDKIISLLEHKTETSLVQRTEVTDIVVKPKVVKPKSPKKKVKEEEM